MIQAQNIVSISILTYTVARQMFEKSILVLNLSIREHQT